MYQEIKRMFNSVQEHHSDEMNSHKDRDEGYFLDDLPEEEYSEDELDPALFASFTQLEMDPRQTERSSCRLITEANLPFDSIASAKSDIVIDQEKVSSYSLIQSNLSFVRPEKIIPELERGTSESEMKEVTFSDVLPSSSNLYKSPATVAQSLSPLIRGQRRTPVIKRVLMRKNREEQDQEQSLSSIASEDSFSSLEVVYSSCDIDVGKKRVYFENDGEIDSDAEEQGAEYISKKLRR